MGIRREMTAAGLPVVVGVDGCESGLRAVEWAAAEAVRREVPLRVVHAALGPHCEGAPVAREPGGPARQAGPGDIVDAAARRARRLHPDLPVHVEVVPEEPEYELVRRSRQASAVVVGTHGRSGVAEALLGSVGLTVAAHAHCPVIVVRGGGHPPRGRVVVGVGEGPETPAAVRFAVEEARRRGVPLDAVRVWRRPAREPAGRAPAYGERAAALLRAALREAPPDLRVDGRTVEGHARTVLAEASLRADLLVLGAERRGRHGRPLSRVAQAVLHRAACPVALVPQRA
ncbi:universal stress protein [Streptomyces sp. CC219B]|uniref:universal stress protein n=1 Tax=Streptomyces sp. CC219B TaxID=3044574 RepID=UPI0024A82C16|nr:universal stress protein [Streptomyces sp. CC219B]